MELDHSNCCLGDINTTGSPRQRLCPSTSFIPEAVLGAVLSLGPAGKETPYPGANLCGSQRREDRKAGFHQDLIEARHTPGSWERAPPATTKGICSAYPSRRACNSALFPRGTVSSSGFHPPQPHHLASSISDSFPGPPEPSHGQLTLSFADKAR